MPWCEQCDRFWNPNSMERDGSCPTCGDVIGESISTPWHFKLLLVAMVLYLGWRAVQGIAWLLHHL